MLMQFIFQLIENFLERRRRDLTEKKLLRERRQKYKGKKLFKIQYAMNILNFVQISQKGDKAMHRDLSPLRSTIK